MPTFVTYSALITACEKGQDLAKALQHFKDSLHLGIKPDIITYNALISACGKGKQTERALEILEEMKQQGLEPDIIIYNHYLIHIRTSRRKSYSRSPRTPYQKKKYRRRE
mgnify:CR=1 FL=1